ncbi:MAG: universal stress protein [Acidobacteria bacterium]|nr:universal stress protein [Acidobacteriota bacterium]
MAENSTDSIFEFQSIVFATDFSPASQNAGCYASALSIHFRAQLVVVHAFTLHQAALEVEMEKQKESHQRIVLNQDLLLAAQSLKGGKGETEAVLVEGDPQEVIPAFAQLRRSALIVTGTHGGGSIDRLLLGSTSEGILRHSSGPAFIVGPRVSQLANENLTIGRILYATDCSAESAHAASLAIALANSFSAELDVLHVLHSHEVDRPEQISRLQEYFYGAVGKIIPSEATNVCQPHTFISEGSTDSQILAHVKSRQIDLLVLGLRRNRHLGMQNHTSGVFPIIIEASCPVVTSPFGSVYPLETR